MCSLPRVRRYQRMWSGLALLELRAHVVWVLVDDPGDEIGDALSGRMWNHPEFEVLGAVVEADPVPVVDELVRCELAPRTASMTSWCSPMRRPRSGT
jgi:hypothetical protein